ncbi:MAG: malto-oligosyltrehalose synthase [Chloroflexi bacterium]|nr:malto-oligosyltrehalose synthase [Chloroflexota bacterium]
MRVPSATYRLQCSASVQFDDARALVPYLSLLGVTELYTSPLLAARPGSSHGYDVVDPTRLNPELGGEPAFERLSAALRQHGMGLLLDIVPNHMVAGPENPWWADVLARGAASPHANVFDIDWQAGGGKVVLPILDAALREVVERGELSVELDEDVPCLRYQDVRLPLADATHPAARAFLGTSAAAADVGQLNQLLAAQHYRLAYWRTGRAEINYRRFFDVNDLAGVRVEDEDVFDATHALLLRLATAGQATGLRIDHIDGLYDPLQYLRRLQSRLPDDGDFYLLVEKILTGEEQTPDGWPVAGTTGYDFLNTVSGLFVDAAGLASLRASYAEFTGLDTTLAEVARQQKLRVAQELFPAELASLARQLRALAGEEARDLSDENLCTALAAVAASFPVYRTYVDSFAVSDRDRGIMVRALDGAAGARALDGAISSAHGPDELAPAFALLRRVLLLELPETAPSGQREAWLRFVMRWQQFTGPVTAKGLEDTALYVHHPLLSLNEVGVDPDAAGAVDVETFHQRNRIRLRRSPHTMNATATHDSKRGEDARARINVLSEVADEWATAVRRWSEQNRRHTTLVANRPAPDANEEWLIYQSLAGAWPLDDAELPSFKERMEAYLVKAVREAKLHSSWLDPNEAYERAISGFLSAILTPGKENEFLSDFLRFQQRVAFYGAANSLAQTLLKIASPGVPDIYQGTELWDFSFVDPDNRRPVDFARRARLLDELHSGEANGRSALVQDMLAHWQDGRIKLYLTAKALAFRRDNAVLFSAGDYLPLAVSGKNAEHAVAFARRHETSWALAVAPRLVAGLSPAGEWAISSAVWGDTAVELPEGAPKRWSSALTGEVVGAKNGALPLSAVLAELPVALLSAAQS